MASQAHGPQLEWVVTARMMPWAWTAFAAALVFMLWFFSLLVIEQRVLVDDPSGWTGLSTDQWGTIGLLLYAAVIIFFLVVLVRREVHARTFTIDAHGRVSTVGQWEGAKRRAPEDETESPPVVEATEEPTDATSDVWPEPQNYS